MKIIDIDNWSRGKLFRFYIDDMRIVMSLTVDIDVTALIEISKKCSLKFYPVMIWTVSKIVNSHSEFKYGWDGQGRLVKWDFISPSYAVFHKDDECFTKYVTEYSDNLFEFCDRFIEDGKKYDNTRNLAEEQPENHFDVSCLPWVRYKHFDVHVFDDGKFLAPVVTWGKYENNNGRFIMPFTMNIHHAVADGFHLSRFFNEVQGLIDSMDLS